jgi:hypothetical protein
MKNMRTFMLIFASLVLGVEAEALAVRPDSSVVVGPTFSNYSFDPATSSTLGTNLSTGVGFSFGSFFGMDFSDDIGGEFGILYAKRITGGLSGGANYNATILNLPVLVRLSPFSGLRGLKIEVGPYFGFLPSASITNGANTVASTANTDTVDIGATGGLSYFAPINEGLMFRVTALYSYGFVDINSGSAEIKTRGLDTYIGLVFLR